MTNNSNIVDLEKLDAERNIAIKLIAIQEGDIIIDKEGNQRLVSFATFWPNDGILNINNSHFDLEGDRVGFTSDEFNGNEIVDVIFADRNK